MAWLHHPPPVAELKHGQCTNLARKNVAFWIVSFARPGWRASKVLAQSRIGRIIAGVVFFAFIGGVSLGIPYLSLYFSTRLLNSETPALLSPNNSVVVEVGTWIRKACKTDEECWFTHPPEKIWKETRRTDLPFIWPLPKQFNKGQSIVFISRRLHFHLSGGGAVSKILSRAWRRYWKIIFTHPDSKGHHQTLPHGASMIDSMEVFVMSGDEKLFPGVDEGYELEILLGGRAIKLQARTIYGALRGLETLSQLCEWSHELKAVFVRGAPWTIVDAPANAYRGLLLDTARHFEPLLTIKRVIDAMAFAKLNVLHWHLVDQQAFPMEVLSLPRLWQGAFSQEERYTVEDMHHIVQYARLRGVAVVPGLEAPGRVQSWGVGYPDLVTSPDCPLLDVSNNATLQALDSIFKDLLEVFSQQLIHLGGTVPNTSCWSTDPRMSKWLQDNKLSEEDAWSAFLQRLHESAVRLGWRAITWKPAWDHVGSQLGDGVLVQTLSDADSCQAVTKQGRQCICSSGLSLADLQRQWHEFYRTDPREGIEDPQQRALVLGGEALMWGEAVDSSVVITTIFPRAAALAERLWSAEAYVNNLTAQEKDVQQRLENFRCKMHMRGVPMAPVFKLDEQDANRVTFDFSSCYNERGQARQGYA